jgi:hypothetical protein
LEGGSNQQLGFISGVFKMDQIDDLGLFNPLEGWSKIESQHNIE